MTPEFLLSLVKNSHNQGRYNESELYIELGIKKFPSFLNELGFSYFLEEKVKILLDKKQIKEALSYVNNMENKEWFYKICFLSALDTNDYSYREEIFGIIPDFSKYKAYSRSYAQKPFEAHLFDNCTKAINEIKSLFIGLKFEDALNLLELNLEKFKENKHIYNYFLNEIVSDLLSRRMYGEYTAIIREHEEYIPYIYDTSSNILIKDVWTSEVARRALYFRSLAKFENNAKMLSRLAKDACSVNYSDLAIEAANQIDYLARKNSIESEIFNSYLILADANLSARRIDLSYDFYHRANSISKGDLYSLLGICCSCLEKRDYDTFVRYAKTCKETKAFTEVLAHIYKLIDVKIDNINRDEKNHDVGLFIFSHPTERMSHNHDLAPPNTKMIEDIISNSNKRVGSVEINTNIVYDHRETVLGVPYKENLLKLAESKDVNIIINENNGLRKQWLESIARSNEEFILVIEQDHELLENCPSWMELIEIFHKRPDINYIKINRDKNIADRFDFFANQSIIDYQDNLTKTSLFSNTPHIMRRSFFNSFILPIISNNDYFDGGNDGASGIEESVNVVIENVASYLGWQITSRLLGLSIWGNIGDDAVVNHLGY